MAFMKKVTNQRWMFYLIPVILLMFLLISYGGYDENYLANIAIADGRCSETDGYCSQIRTQKQPYELAAREQARRKRQLKEACNRLNVSRTKHVRTWVNPNQSLAYCRINKCLSTFNIELLTILFPGMTDGPTSLPWGNQSLIPAGIFKYLFVREPYGRFFSYYCNRFFAPKGNWKPMSLDIIKKYRYNPSKASLAYGHDLQFSELIQFVVDETKNGFVRDEHLRRLHIGCNPCTMDYDLIGKLETSRTDIEYMVHQWYTRNITDTEVSPDLITHLHSSLTHNIVHRLYNTSFAERPDKSPIPLHHLFTRLWAYYQIHGHISNKIPLPFSKDEAVYLNKTTFIKAVKQAMERSKTMPGVREQKLDAMRQAYASVQMPLLQELRHRVVHVDCQLFGYNDAPDFVFDRSSRHEMKQEFDYFKAIKLD